jgi:hypothetical protein
MQNRPRAAVDAYDRLASDVRTLRHSIGTWRMSLLTQALHLIGDHARELEESRRGQQYAPGMLFFVEGEVRALAALGRLGDGRRSSIEPGHPRDRRHSGRRPEQAAAAARARPARGIVGARRPRVEWQRTRPAAVAATVEQRFALGRALYLAERWKEAEPVFAALAAEQPLRPGFLGHVGTCAAGRTTRRRARGLARTAALVGTARARRRLDAQGLFWHARVAAVLGEQ